MKLGFLTHVHGPGRAAADVYRELIEFYVAADELGVDSGWVAQHHLRGDYGRLPSPLVFLAGAAERTRRIRLGTGVTVLPLEDPLRLAEDAAVVDALSGRRLELGLGTGGANSDAFAAFGLDPADARSLFDEKLTALRSALRGDPLPAGPATGVDGGAAGPDAAEAAPADPKVRILQPPARSLAGRLWVSTGSPDRAADVARSGDGLLLGTAFHDPLTVQRPLAEAFLSALPAVGQPGTVGADAAGAGDAGGGPQRIGIVRAVFPAADKRTARNDLAPALAVLREGARRRGDTQLASLDTDATLARLNVHYGHPDEIIESLRADPALFPYATEFIPVVTHEASTLDDEIRRLEVIATKIAPELGWEALS